MLSLALAVIFCPALIFLLAIRVIRGLRSGTIDSLGGRVARHNQPNQFWLAVVGEIVFAGLVVLILYGEIIR